MFKKYMVYIDDGKSVYKIAVPAPNPETAARYCDGNGEVIAVKEVSDLYNISANAVFDALDDAGFSRIVIDYITRVLMITGIADCE